MQFFTENPEEMLKSEPFGFEVDLAWLDLPLSSALASKVAEYEKPCADDENTFTIFLLSAVEGPVGLRLNVHGHIKDGKLTHFQLNLDRKPKSAPPPHIQKMSDKFGGYPEGFKTLFGELEGQKGPCDADVRFLFKKSPFKTKPRECGDDVAPFTWTGETINLSEPSGTSVEISLLEDNAAMVKIACEFDLAIGLDCFEAAAEILREKLNPLLNK